MQSTQGFPFWKPLFMGWYIATPSRRLPVSTCHRQLDTDTGVERIVPPLLVVRRISRRTERKQGCPVSGHPFQKGQGDLWRFIIWRPRWSAVEPGAPLWLLRPNEERKARTRRLIERGAILEGIFPLAPDLPGVEVKAFLIALSHLPGAAELAAKLPKSGDKP